MHIGGKHIEKVFKQLDKDSMELKSNDTHIDGIYCKFACDYGVGEKNFLKGTNS
jgi:hypothetical protein